MELSHAGDDKLPGLRIILIGECRVFHGKCLKGLPELILLSCALGFNRD